MTSGGTWFLVTCATLSGGVWTLRRVLAVRGHGLLAQREFRRRHGRRLAALLDGQLDPQHRSPWIEFHLGGRPARLVAAPLGDETSQAGVELAAWSLPVQVWHATSEGVHELEIPSGVDRGAVEQIATQLAELGVDNVASPDMDGGTAHLLRVRFTTFEQLRERLESIAPLLEQLERCQAPND